MKLIITILFSLLNLAGIAQNRLALGASTNGVGISYRRTINGVIDVGGSINYLHITGNTKNVILENIVNSKFSANIPLLEGFIQWKPFSSANASKLSDDVVSEYSTSKSPFRERFFIKSGLAVRLNSRFSTNSTFYDKTLIGSFELTPDQVGYVNIKVSTNTIQPMVAVGYPIFNSEKFFMTAEAGSYFHGTPKVSMEATGTLHLNTVNQTAIQNTIRKYKYFPLLKIETGIKF